jgi:arginyl-tRNA synthetase
MEPKLIAQYAYDLATIFNLFYEKLPILKEKNIDISNTRISLVKSIRLMLEMNLSLIGITPLERM